MERKFISVVFEIPGFRYNCISFRASTSILDADIILFSPNLSGYEDDFPPYFQGKRSLAENSSFKLLEDITHWRNEIISFLKAGKTVFVIFDNYEEVYVHTGQKTVTGTGKNAKTTNLVTLFNSYKFFPFGIPAIVPKSGKTIKFLNSPIFSTLWDEFRNYFCFNAYFDSKIENPIFVTKTGEKPIGGIFRYETGNLVLLPVIDFNQKGFSRVVKDEEYWTNEAIKIGKRLIQILFEIDENLTHRSESTPLPEWVINEPKYVLRSETEINYKIAEIEKNITELTNKKNEHELELFGQQKIKGLLYEKGKPLENAIIEALKLLGYSTENYNNGDLELDQIIISPEGDRFIGEAEGKDNSSINIDKFRQLTNNIQEDYKKEEVQELAIGILFGNGYRLMEPSTRPEQFTEKCIKSANKLNVILIRTCDLFPIAKYLKEHEDPDFSKMCRGIIEKSTGEIVNFPSIPKV